MQNKVLTVREALQPTTTQSGKGSDEINKNTTQSGELVSSLVF